jgi:hypothetical protein
MDLADLEGMRARAAERTVLGGYLTSDEVESALQTLAAAHPNVASVVPLREKTWEGRASHVLRVRAGSQASRRPHHRQYARPGVGRIGHLRGIRDQPAQVLRVRRSAEIRGQDL